MAKTPEELMKKINERDKCLLDQLDSWIDDGRMDVSPKEAAPFFGIKNHYGLNVGDNESPRPGFTKHGRNTRISVRYLIRYMEGSA